MIQSSGKPKHCKNMGVATGRRDDRPIYRPGNMASGTERERKTKTAAKKKFIAERQSKKERRGRGIGADRSDETTRRFGGGGARDGPYVED